MFTHVMQVPCALVQAELQLCRAQMSSKLQALELLITLWQLLAWNLNPLYKPNKSAMHMRDCCLIYVYESMCAWTMS